MSRIKILLAVCAYAQAQPYLRELFDSVEAQTYTEFDAVLFCSEQDHPLLCGYAQRDCIHPDLSIPEVRLFCIDYALDKGYSLVVFVDADDVIAADRVEQTIRRYQENPKHAFYYTELNLLSCRDTSFFSKSLPAETTDFEQISFGNYVGFSTLAFNLEVFRSQGVYVNAPDNIIAYDWYLTAILLLQGAKGSIVPSKTFYRIYDNNTAGFTNTSDEETLRKTVAVKYEHYSTLHIFAARFITDPGAKLVFIRQQGLRYKALLDASYGKLVAEKNYFTHYSASHAQLWWTQI